MMTDLKVMTDVKKQEALKKALPAYQTFDNIVDAQVAIETAKDALGENFIADVFLKWPDDSENWDNANICVAHLTKETPDAETGKKSQMTQAIVVFPIFDTEALLGDAQGIEMVAKIINLQQRHISMRAVRSAESVEELELGLQSSPDSIAAYATISSRAGSGINYEPFNVVYDAVRKHIKGVSPAVAAAFPYKAELLKCIRSASYAVATHPNLENSPAGQNLFTRFLELAIDAAAGVTMDAEDEPLTLETDTMKGWLLGRDDLHLTVPKVMDEATLEGFTL